MTLRSACMWLASVAAVACLTACHNGTLSISLPTSSPSHDSSGQDATQKLLPATPCSGSTTRAG